jgi:DNA excision repair protein ERCC-2
VEQTEQLLKEALSTFAYFPTEIQKRILEIIFLTQKRKIFSLIEAANGLGKTTCIAVAAKVLSDHGIKSAIFCSTYSQIARVISEIRKLAEKQKVITIGSRSAFCCADGISQPKAICTISKLRGTCVFGKPTMDHSKWLLTKEEAIEYYASKGVCAYEASWKSIKEADIIVCPQAYLLYEEPWFKISQYLPRSFVFVDECHNLINKGVNCFSFELRFTSKVGIVFERILRSKRIWSKKALLEKFTKICDPFSAFEKEAEEQIIMKNVKYLNALVEDYEKIKLLSNEFYEKLYIRNNICEGFVGIPEDKLSDRFVFFESGIFVSATPGSLEAYEVIVRNRPLFVEILPSPYTKKDLSVLLIDDFTTRYIERKDKDYYEVANRVEKIFAASPGRNIAVYFPSYEYLYKTLDELLMIDPYWRLTNDQTTYILLKDQVRLIFDVQGGKSAEGHEYTGGVDIVLVVGLGLPFPKPFLTKRVNKYRRFYHKNSEIPAYISWSVQKAVQAVGRSVRGPNDRGIGLLMDKRFCRRDVIQTMPKWFRKCIVKRVDFNNALEYVRRFWL